MAARVAPVLPLQAVQVKDGPFLAGKFMGNHGLWLAFILFIFWIGIAPSGYFALIDTSVEALVSELSASVVAMPIP